MLLHMVCGPYRHPQSEAIHLLGQNISTVGPDWGTLSLSPRGGSSCIPEDPEAISRHLACAHRRALNHDVFVSNRNFHMFLHRNYVGSSTLQISGSTRHFVHLAFMM